MKKLIALLIVALFSLLFVTIIPAWWFNRTLNHFEIWYPDFGRILFFYLNYGFYPQFLIALFGLVYLIYKRLKSGYGLKWQKTLHTLVYLSVFAVALSVFYIFHSSYYALQYSSYPKKNIVIWEDKRNAILDSLANCENLQDSIICINRFAYRDALHGGRSIRINSVDINKTALQWEAEVFAHYFSEDKLTVNCDGNSMYNVSLYKEFMDEQLKSYRYFIGIPNDPEKKGHAINLLVTNTKQYYLIDPMFNSWFADESGNLIDLRKLILKYRLSDMDSVRLAYIPEKAQCLTYSEAVTLIDHPLFDEDKEGYFLRSNNDEFPLVFNCERNLKDYLEPDYYEDYQDIAAYYGRTDLKFTDEKDFVNCFAFVSLIEGEGGEDILKEIRNWFESDIRTLEQLQIN